MPIHKNVQQVVYLICVYQDSIKHREKLILSLKASFDKIVLVTKRGTINDSEQLVVGAYPNPFGIFRLLGLHSMKRQLERYCYFPSTDILFVKSVVNKLIKKIHIDFKKKKKVTLITCLPPHTLSFVGLSLKKKFPEIHWIVDWQDLWSYDEYYFNRIPKLYKKRLLKKEKEILETCDINVTTNQNAKRVLENHYGISGERIISIPHPFYPPDFNNSGQVPNRIGPKGNDRINIGFLGNLFKPPKVPGDRVVDAIEHVNKSGICVRFHIFGDRSIQAKQIAGQSRDRLIKLHPRTSHEESLQKISDCDFLLLALSDLPNCHNIMHSKLPHYLMLKRPILAMVPNKSAVADIVTKTGSGFVIDTDSDWGHALNKIFNDYLEGKNLPFRDEIEIEKYSWSKISIKWLNVLCGEQNCC